MTTELAFAFGPEIEKLAAALVVFQDKAEAVPKQKTAKVQMKNGGQYTYDYADLADVIACTRAARTAAGLAVVQMPIGDANAITIVTTVLHTSGQWMRASLTLRPEDQRPQTIGSLITYMRRYCYSAALGICTDDDDDGVAATQGAPRGQEQKKTAAQSQPANRVAHDGTKATPDQVKRIHVLKAKVGGMSEDLYRRQLAAFKDADGKPITTSKDLSTSQASLLIKRYDEKIAQQEATAAKGVDLGAMPMDLHAAIKREGERREIDAGDILAVFGVDTVDELSAEQAKDAYALVSAWGTPGYERVLSEIQTRA